MTAPSARPAKKPASPSVPGDLTFVHVVHYRAPGSEGRIGFFFLTEKRAGDPWNREPDKCAGLIWSDPAHLDTADAVELTELLQFVKEWLTTDNGAKASFARFVGSPGYNAADLCADIDRLSFLLGGNDGEHLLA